VAGGARRSASRFTPNRGARLWRGSTSAAFRTASLTQIADEASEVTTDRYECDVAFEGGRIRLWFGLCPQTPPDVADWREVLPELPPIPLSAFIRG